MYCKDCKYYKPEEIERCTNKDEPMYDSAGGKIPRRYEIIGVNPYCECTKYIIDGCDISFNEDKHKGMVLTYDGSSYLSGHTLSEYFGCVHFEKKEIK